MKTFQIALDTVPEKCLTVEFPDGKDYFFESSRQSVRIFEYTRNSCGPKDVPIFEYVAESYTIKGVMAEVSHTPMIEVELVNGDILKFSWVDVEGIDVYVRLGNFIFDEPESDYHVWTFIVTRTLHVSMSLYTHLYVFGDCIISSRSDVNTPDIIDWYFAKYKVNHHAVVFSYRKPA